MKSSFVVLGVLFYSAAVYAADSVETYAGDQADVVSIAGTVGNAAGEIHKALLKSGATESGGCGQVFVQFKSIEANRNEFNDNRSVNLTVDHVTSKVTIAKDDQGTVVTLEGQSAQDLFEMVRAAGFPARLTCGAQFVTGKHVACAHFGPGSSYDCSIRLDN